MTHCFVTADLDCVSNTSFNVQPSVPKNFITALTSNGWNGTQIFLRCCSKIIILNLDWKLFISFLDQFFDLINFSFNSVQSLSRVRFCDPMNRSTPGLPVHHQLPEFTQTHIHRVSDAIQPSHPLSSPSPTAPNPSQHQGLFQWINSSHEVAKVLEFQLQHQSF